MFKNTKVIFFISLIAPIFLSIQYYLASKEISVLFLIIIISYYLIVFYIYSEIKKNEKNKLPRSPIIFIRKFNATGNKDYWEKSQKKPLRDLLGVEVGVNEGEHSIKILNYLNIEKLYLIDPWKEYVDARTGKVTLGNQNIMDKRYNKVKNLFSKYSNIELLRETSKEASGHFKNNSLDFVYIDGDHSYENVKLDLNLWYPKLKLYGVLGGDDYGHISGRGVVKAVNEFSFEKKEVIMYGEDNQFWLVKTNEE